MKKTALVLVFLVGLLSCFSSCNGFPKGKTENNATDKDIKKINDDIGKINVEIDNLKKGQGGSGTGGGNNTSPQGTTKRILVTPKIVQFLLQNKADGIKFYLSRPFTLKIYEKNETKEIEISNNMVILNPANPANEEEIIFSVDSEGILSDIPGPDKGGELQINFNEKGKILRFRRNGQHYELFDVKIIDNRHYKINIPPEPIQLCVSGEDNRKPEVQAVPTDFVYNNVQPYQNINAGFINDNYSFNRPVISSRTVIGSGSTNRQRVLEYVRKNNLALKNSDIEVIDDYFRIARNNGVNVDLAIAQMLYATNNLKRVSNYNYGGLKDCRFRNRTEGVLAHIQHLLAYAHQPVPVQQIVDPRFNNALERGYPGITFDQIYLFWAPQNPNYRWSIEKILREL